MKSMTGYGSAERNTSKHRVKVEFKSLNGKFLEINLRVPKMMSDKEAIIRNHFGNKLVRGSVLIVFVMERTADAEDVVAINEELATAYYGRISNLAEKLDASDDDLLSIVLSMPDVLKADEKSMDDEEWGEVLSIAEEAMQKLDDFRLEEGAVLKDLLTGHNNVIKKLNEEVSLHDLARREAMRNKILSSIKENFADESYDKNRFEQELIYYLEKLDISEERNRLESHCAMFEDELNGSASGKKLGFISQEMGREINTMGSKANFAEIQRLVVEMKEELEKIKEQVLNVV